MQQDPLVDTTCWVGVDLLDRFMSIQEEIDWYIRL